jgi:hypothetical protein
MLVRKSSMKLRLVELQKQNLKFLKIIGGLRRRLLMKLKKKCFLKPKLGLKQ